MRERQAAERGERVYHPDPEINAEVAAEELEAERFDLSIGYPPRRWKCPDCAAEHSRGHFYNIGAHRCLRCGYAGTGGVMFLPEVVSGGLPPERAS